MFQIITLWNLSNLKKETIDKIEEIKLRGYNSVTFLTGEFANKIVKKEIKPLPVSNIADKICPTRRDLYLEKGINNVRIRGKKKWGRIAGNFTDLYIQDFYNKIKNMKLSRKYKGIRKKGNKLHNDFLNLKNNRRIINKLKKSEEISHGVESGDSEWFLRLLNNNISAELSKKLLHSFLKENDSLDTPHIKITKKEKEIKPNKKQIGINSPATPDFIIPEFGIVGDIKTGNKFLPYFQLTCTGYALAYENEKGINSAINWGIIYFLPTHNPSIYVRPITYAQIYIFLIDDNLRETFIVIRDEAYNIISKEEPPDFPKENNRKQCNYCKYLDYCISQGLELKEND